MDWLTFITKIVEALVWPIVVVVILCWPGKHFVELLGRVRELRLSSRGLTLTLFSAAPTAPFRRRLATRPDQAPTISPPITAPVTAEE